MACEPGLQQTLKSLRHSLGLSLDEVREKTGVSKAMLSKIERGDSSPTITTLWKIASGLKVPLSAFLYPVCQIQRGIEDPEQVILDEESKMRAYPIYPFDPLRGNETFRIEFDPFVSHLSSNHSKGVVEEVLVLEGKIIIHVGKQQFELHQNQALRFQADLPHQYQTKDQSAIIYNIIYYPG